METFCAEVIVESARTGRGVQNITHTVLRVRIRENEVTNHGLALIGECAVHGENRVPQIQNDFFEERHRSWFDRDSRALGPKRDQPIVFDDGPIL